MQIFEIQLPLLQYHKDQQIYYKYFYFTADTSFPLYQIKYWEMKGYYFHEKMLQDKVKLMSQLKQLAKPIQTINRFQESICPQLQNMHPFEIEELFILLNSNFKHKVFDVLGDKQFNNSCYCLAKIFEYQQQYQQAIEYYKQGADTNEFGCCLKLFQIYCDQNECKKFSQINNYEQALHYFFTCIFNNGIFTKIFQSYKMPLLHLFYIYIDCYDSFQQFIFQFISKREKQKHISLKQLIECILLKFLIVLNPESNSDCYDLFNNMEDYHTFLAKKENQRMDILMGDLLHPMFLGLSVESEFNSIQSYYKNAIKHKQGGALLRIVQLNQNLINAINDKQNITQIKNAKETETLEKISKNLIMCIDQIQRQEELKLNEDIICLLSNHCDHFIPSNLFTSDSTTKRKKIDQQSLQVNFAESTKILQEEQNDSVLLYFKKLHYIGSQKLLLERFLLHKIQLSQMKQGDFIANLQSINKIKEQMFILSVKMVNLPFSLQYSNFKKRRYLEGVIWLGYCLQKGIGIQKNDYEALHVYQQQIMAIIQNSLNYSSQCFYAGQILKKDSEFQQQAQLFYEIFYYKLISNLQADKTDYFSFLHLIKLYRFGFFEQNLQYCYEMVLSLQEFLQKIINKSIYEKILFLLSQNLLGKIQKQAINQNLIIGRSQDEAISSYEEIIDKEYQIFKIRFTHTSLYEKRQKGNLADNIQSIMKTVINKFSKIYPKSKENICGERVENIYQSLSKENNINYNNIIFNKTQSQYKKQFYSNWLILQQGNEENQYQLKVTIENNNLFNYEKSLTKRIPEIILYYSQRLNSKIHLFSEIDVKQEIPIQKIYLSQQLYFTKYILQVNQQEMLCFEQEFNIQNNIESIESFFRKLEQFILWAPSLALLNLYGIAISQVDDVTLQVKSFYEPFDQNFYSFQSSFLNYDQAKIDFISQLILFIQSLNNSLAFISVLDPNFFCFLSKHSIPKFVDPSFVTLHLTNKPTTQQFESAKSLIDICGKYCPPEIFYSIATRDNFVLSQTSCFWSLGVLIYELLVQNENKNIIEFEKLQEKFDKEKFFQIFQQSLINSKIKQIKDNKIVQLLNLILLTNQNERSKVNIQQIFSQYSSADQEKYSQNLLQNQILNCRFKNKEELQIHQNITIYLSQGYIYQGNLLNGLPHDKGTLYKNDQSQSFKGDFNQGMFHGENCSWYNAESNIEFNGSYLFNGPTNGSIKEITRILSLNSDPIQKLSFISLQQEGILQILSPNQVQQMVLQSTNKLIENETKFNEQKQLIHLENIINYINTLKNDFNKQKCPFLQCNLKGILQYSNINLLNELNSQQELKTQFQKAKEEEEQKNSNHLFIAIQKKIMEFQLIVFDSRISKNDIFYMNQFEFGIFSRDSKSEKNLGPMMIFENNQFGHLISLFGSKKYGIFNNFSFIQGIFASNNESQFFKEINKTQIIFNGNLKISDHKQYSGQIIADKCHGYGEEIINKAFNYKGQFRNNFPQGFGLLSTIDGIPLFKGFFKKGQPTWGLLYHGNDKKFEGKIILKNDQMTIYNIKSAQQLLENMSIEGWLTTNSEKIISKWGLFKNIEDTNLSGYYKIKYRNGHYFEGHLIDGEREGKGEFYIKESDGNYIIMSGIWQKSKLNGQVIFEKNSKYQYSLGEFRLFNNMTFSIENFTQIQYKKIGKSYIGKVKQNELNGLGELQYYQQNDSSKPKIYIGEFKEGKKEGFGILKEFNFEYRGNFVNSKKQGVGCLYIKNNKYIDGFWNENILQFGILYLTNHNAIIKIESSKFNYSQETQLYEPQGYGIIYLKNQKQIECNLDGIMEDINKNIFNKRIGLLYISKNLYYEGVIENYEVNGYGVQYQNGNLIYEGHFKSNAYHGQGILYLQDQNKTFRGMFDNGKWEGLGELSSDIEINGSTQIGLWKNGIKQGKHQLSFYENGQKRSIFLNYSNDNIFSAQIDQ